MKKWILIVILMAGAAFAVKLGFPLIFDRKEVSPVPVSITLAHDKGNIQFFQENFTKQGQMSQKVTGIGITVQPSITPDLYVNQMKSVLSTDQAPEMFTWWSKYRASEILEAGFVTDLTDLWDKHRDGFSPQMRAAFTHKGRVFGFPYVLEYWPVWYNKKIFARLGLTEPGTWDEFIKICETLKAANITPILSSLQNVWPAFIWFEEMLIREDPDLYTGLCSGRIRYTDPRVVKACLVWKDMIRKGYFTDPSANMFTNAGHLWNSENFGMVLCGTWYYSSVLIAQGVDERDVGVFIMPSHNPAAGKNIIFEVGPLFTAKNAPHADAALKVVDWWMSPEGSSYFSTIHEAYPVNANSGLDHLPKIKRDLGESIKKDNYRLLNRYWEATPTPICEMAVDKLGEFILNPDKLETVLKDIDRFADHYWANNPD